MLVGFNKSSEESGWCGKGCGSSLSLLPREASASFIPTHPLSCVVAGTVFIFVLL